MQTILLIGQCRACVDWVKRNLEPNLANKVDFSRGTVDMPDTRYRFIRSKREVQGYGRDAKFIVLYGADPEAVEMCRELYLEES